MAGRKAKKLDKAQIAAWNAHDMEAFAEMCAEDIVWQNTGAEPTRGREAVHDFWVENHTAFPDLQIEVTSRVAGKGSVAAEYVFTGTHTGPLTMAEGAPPVPATGKKVAVHGSYFVRYSKGKMVEGHILSDNASMMMQLGLLELPGG